MKLLKLTFTLVTLGCVLSLISSNLPVRSSEINSDPPISNSLTLKTHERQYLTYIWPTSGVITSGFGVRWNHTMHTGIDIAGPRRTPVFAAASGVVVFVGWNPEGLGNLVTIRHVDGSRTLYGHNCEILVHYGQIVEQGEQISLMGSTGYSTGSHLHFEVHLQGKVAVDPMGFLPGYLEDNGMKRVATDIGQPPLVSP